MRILIVLILSVILGKSEVPLSADYEFLWTPRPDREAVTSYWIYRRVAPSTFWSVALITTNSSRAVIESVNTILPYEWSIAPSNSLGIGPLSAIAPTPANPRAVTDCRVVKVTVRGELPMVFQSSIDFKTWTPEIFIYGKGTTTVSRVPIPGDNFRFWRAVQVGTTQIRPPTPSISFNKQP